MNSSDSVAKVYILTFFFFVIIIIMLNLQVFFFPTNGKCRILLIYKVDTHLIGFDLFT